MYIDSRSVFSSGFATCFCTNNHRLMYTESSIASVQSVGFQSLSVSIFRVFPYSSGNYIFPYSIL